MTQEKHKLNMDGLMTSEELTVLFEGDLKKIQISAPLRNIYIPHYLCHINLELKMSEST